MVYTGKPSTGCENCRKSKKKCDQGLPTCGRCARLGKTCGGYRDVSDLLFRDESKIVSQRVSAINEASSSTPALPPRQPSPEKETVARTFFFNHFVTPAHLAALEDITLDAFLSKPILACAFAVISNRNNNDAPTQALARRHYGDAIVATNLALRHPQRVKEDNTLIAVFLLGIFECLVWDPEHSMQSWTHHVEGSGMLLQLRGRTQIRNKIGASLFRDFRGAIMTMSLRSETTIPDYVTEWTQALEFDAEQNPADQLVLLASRLASARQAFRTGEKTDSELKDITDMLEKDLLAWSESTLAEGSVGSFHDVHDLTSRHAWKGTRHEYGIPQAFRHWNTWRSLRILLSRLQETLWRRSWPTLAQPSQPIADAEYYRSIRNRMTKAICVAAAYAFGDDTSAEPPRGSVSSGYIMTGPLSLAGSCILEQLSEIITSPGGHRIMLVDQPLHTDPYNQLSVQLAWLIQRVEYIANKAGISWGREVSRFLKGEKNMYYDVGRSHVFRTDDVKLLLGSDMLDLSGIIPEPEKELLLQPGSSKRSSQKRKLSSNPSEEPTTKRRK